MAGFHNVRARTRDERRAVSDKESWEKARLQQRKECFVRVDPTLSGHAMTEYDPKAQGFLSDADRFHTDTAGEQKLERTHQRNQARVHCERKRFDLIQKDESRWKSMETQYQEEQKKWEDHRKAGLKARSNTSSVPFNPITLDYNATDQGQKLKMHDDNIKIRAQLRAQALRHHHCRGGIHPITGEPYH